MTDDRIDDNQFWIAKCIATIDQLTGERDEANGQLWRADVHADNANDYLDFVQSERDAAQIRAFAAEARATRAEEVLREIAPMECENYDHGPAALCTHYWPNNPNNWCPTCSARAYFSTQEDG